MKFLVCFFQLRIRHVGIHLSRGDRSMAEEFLYDTYIRTICQKSRRKTMTKCVGMEIFQYASSESVALYHICDEKSWETHFLIWEMDRLDIFFREIVSDKEGTEWVGTHIKIGSYRISSKLSEVDDTDLASLSTHGEL